MKESKRYAALDIGTNSTRLKIVERTATGGVQILREEKAMTRLGENLQKRGVLSREAMERTLRYLSQFQEIMRGYNVSRLSAVATSATRTARNGRVFVRRVHKDLGLKVKVLSGAEEARLAYWGVIGSMFLPQQRSAIVHLGGGSTEVVLCRAGSISRLYAVELGAVRIAERFKLMDRVRAADLRAAREFLSRQFAKSFRGAEASVLVGSGGTFTSVGYMHLTRRSLLQARVNGHEIERRDVKKMLKELAARDKSERQRIPGLNPQRADIIVAGLLIVDVLMKVLGAPVLKISDRGIRDGLILQMMEKESSGPAAQNGGEQLAGVLQLAEKCNYEKEHAQHVMDLSLQLFDQLHQDLGIPAASKGLLSAASLLHDIGHYISYQKHHKHTYHLIRSSDVTGFTPHQVELIANIARYHRKAVPRKRHRNFGALSEEDRRVVTHLSALLRIADSLDRCHNRNVRRIACRVNSNRILISITAQKNPEIEIWGAMQKADLMQQTFGREVKWAFKIAGSHQDK